MIRSSKGFTIIELLVVIAIVGFLAAVLAVAAVGLTARSKIEKSSAMIRRLDSGCEAYHSRFQDYPAEYAKLTKGAPPWPPIKSDVYLFDYLCKPLTVVEGFTATGSQVRPLDPFIEITESERRGDVTGTKTVQILDAWEGAIWYELPGYSHGANFPDRINKFDLTSWGVDKATTWDKLNPGDDVTNWTYDRR
jgi:prepilin-type N-terminal cleavage/methylation domain-containing protein